MKPLFILALATAVLAGDFSSQSSKDQSRIEAGRDEKTDRMPVEVASDAR